VDWNDNAIYENYGIRVIQGKYSQLFKMLTANRFDGFPRGIGEILTEYEKNKERNPELSIEKNLLIYYPFPTIFSSTNKILRYGTEWKRAYASCKKMAASMRSSINTIKMQSKS
jgi:hypothetical protein